MDYLYNEIIFDDSMVCCYDELPLWSSPFGILLLNNIPFKKNSVIVDIGCGTGFPLVELAQRFGTTCKVYGIDPWEKALFRADKKTEQYRIKNVEIIHGNAGNMPFENSFVDIITSNLGINNFDNPDEVIEECCRVLRPQGTLVFTTNLNGHFNEFYSVFEEVMSSLSLNSEIEKLKKHIRKRHSINDIKVLLKKHNLFINKIVEENYSMRFIDGSAFFNHYFIKLAFIPAWKEIVKADDLKVVFSRLEERLNNISDKNGEIVFNVPMAYIECTK